MKIYHFRILLDSGQDIFRDIEIAANATFLNLHDAIVEAFAFSGLEMASFYMSNDDWDKGEEIALMDVTDEHDEEILRIMDTTKLSDMVEESGEKMLYVYDFLRMWIFFVELVAVKKTEPGALYPRTVLVVGEPPAEDSKQSAGPMQVDFMDEESEDFDDDFDMEQDDYQSPDEF